MGGEAATPRGATERFVGGASDEGYACPGDSGVAADLGAVPKTAQAAPFITRSAFNDFPWGA